MPLQVPLSQEKQLEQQARPDKLAIGGDGGFQLEEDKREVEKSQALMVLPQGLELLLPCPELPEMVLSAIKGVMVRRRSSFPLDCLPSMQQHHSQSIRLAPCVNAYIREAASW